MIKYAVNLIKNTFHPLQVAESAHVEHGQYVLVRTEKGEEVAKVFVVNHVIAKAWEKKKPEPVPLIRVMGKQDMKTLEEIELAQEEAFKLNVYEYCIEVEEYKEQLTQENDKYVEEEFNVYGVDLKSVIPDMVETDLSKFKIERGKLIYIGNDEQEKKWSEEVRL